MPAGVELHVVRNQVGNQLVLQLRERRPPVGHAGPFLREIVGNEVIVDELDRRPGHAEEAQIGLKRIPRHPGPCLLESRRRMFLETDARIRCVQPGGISRAHIGRHIFGVNRHPRTGLLQQQRRRQPQRAAPDHRDVALPGRHRVCRGNGA